MNTKKACAWPPPDKEVLVLKPDFPFMLRKKIPKYASITGFFYLPNSKNQIFKTASILKSKFFDEVQGENSP